MWHISSGMTRAVHLAHWRMQLFTTQHAQAPSAWPQQAQRPALNPCVRRVHADPVGGRDGAQPALGGA